MFFTFLIIKLLRKQQVFNLVFESIVFCLNVKEKVFKEEDKNAHVDPF